MKDSTVTLESCAERKNHWEKLIKIICLKFGNYNINENLELVRDRLQMFSFIQLKKIDRKFDQIW